MVVTRDRAIVTYATDDRVSVNYCDHSRVALSGIKRWLGRRRNVGHVHLDRAHCTYITTSPHLL